MTEPKHAVSLSMSTAAIVARAATGLTGLTHPADYTPRRYRCDCALCRHQPRT